MLRIITAVDTWHQQSQQKQLLPEATAMGTPQQATPVQQQQASFALSLHDLKSACEASLHTLTSACQALVRQPSWHDHPGNDQHQDQHQQHDQHHHQLLNSLLDQCNHHMLSLRFMTAQHMAAWYSIAPQQLRPTHVGPPNSNPFPNLVWQSCPVLQLLQLTVEDCRWEAGPWSLLWLPHLPYHLPAPAGITPGKMAWQHAGSPHCCHSSLLQAIDAELGSRLAMTRQGYHSTASPFAGLPLFIPCRAFCIEKNSTAPPLEVVGDASLRAALVAPYVQYLVTEVLKNGMQVSPCRERCWCAAGALLMCRCCWHGDGSAGV
jgi:hypothetical protein